MKVFPGVLTKSSCGPLGESIYGARTVLSCKISPETSHGALIESSHGALGESPCGASRIRGDLTKSSRGAVTKYENYLLVP